MPTGGPFDPSPKQTVEIIDQGNRSLSLRDIYQEGD